MGRTLTRFLASLIIGSSWLAVGCGGSQEGTSAKVNEEASKKQVSVLKDYFQKKQQSKAGQAK
jgi:hypothetical protein